MTRFTQAINNAYSIRLTGDVNMREATSKVKR